MPLVYVIRHGQASFSKSDYDQLSEKGIEQSKVLGRFFKNTQNRFDSVFSGSLKRQKDTAFHMTKAMDEKEYDQKIIEGFNEYNHLDLINAAFKYYKKNEPEFNADLAEIAKSRKRFQQFFSDAVEKWINGEFSEFGIETYEKYSSKVLNAFEEATKKESEKKIAVVTSGGAVSVLLENTLGITPFKAAELGWGLMNCSVSVVSSKGAFNKDNNRFLLRVFNSAAHFEIEKEKELITYR